MFKINGIEVKVGQLWEVSLQIRFYSFSRAPSKQSAMKGGHEIVEIFHFASGLMSCAGGGSQYTSSKQMSAAPYSPTGVITTRLSDKVICSKCKNNAPMAEPNQPDGTFKCWSCRNGF